MIHHTIRDKNPMPNLTFDFKWYRDLKGYRLIPAKWPKRKPGQSLGDAILDSPSAHTQPSRVVRLGGALQPYRPLEIPDLWRKFMTIQTGSGVMDFIKRCGPLTHAGLRGKGDSIAEVIERAEAMKEAAKGKPFALPLNKLAVTLIRENGELRLKVRPACLLDALWLQFAQANSGPVKFRRCLQCDQPFAAGAGLGRRADAKFCSDECRVRFNSLQRSR